MTVCVAVTKATCPVGATTWDLHIVMQTGQGDGVV